MNVQQLVVDPILVPGAHNAIRVCLNVEPIEKVMLVTDLKTAAIAASLARELDDVGAAYEVFVLEDLAPRPLRNTPAAVLAAADRCDVAIYCVQPQPGEIRSRQQLIDIIEQRQIRYAHMVWITPLIMTQAMCADFRKVDELSRTIQSLAQAARTVHVTSDLGTDITATFYPTYKWVKTSGLISRSNWSNLPGGEVFTCPAQVNGRFVVNGTVGDYLCGKYGELASNPLTLEIENSRLISATSERKDLEEEFIAYCNQDENSDRVGEFAIGTNINVHQLIGNMLQDEKVPGVHIAFGEPCGLQTGADWRCSTHIDAITTCCNIWIGDQQIMRQGEFLL